MSEEKQPFLDASKGFALEELETTADVVIPHDPLARVIGQDEAIELARIAAKQKRHLLLVGPPGTGKSMIGQALSLQLSVPEQEIQVVHNPENPERPVVEIKTREEVKKVQEEFQSAEGEMIDPKEAPINVSEKLGFRCMSCGGYSASKERVCPKCGRVKAATQTSSPNVPFADVLGEMLGALSPGMGNERVTTTRHRFGKEEVVVFERAGEMIRVLDQQALERRRELEKLSPRKVLVSIDRNPFVLATGASETELLGDVKHDPYGGHPQLGIPPYERVVPGSIHEAHEGVLFIDELPHLGHLQTFILTAMQEKRFPISGRNPQSAGASVKVASVPCNFIFVGACNIVDLPTILAPLRSRIIGSGYEILVNTTMPDTEENRLKLVQFIAQEIFMDGRIPHMSRKGVMEIMEEARKRAREFDKQDRSITLRLRELGGLIRTAGDIAVTKGDKFIDEAHIQAAITRSRTAEEQIKDRYGSYQGGVATDMSGAQRSTSPYHYWNTTGYDNGPGYG
ncbi:MAG: AAA family ATPase [Candidatus Thermoplasmatota archaeon]|nr:AAA family ATPase [Candidatus Thermoplasmatota archaeon]